VTSMATDLDPNEENAALLWAEIHRLRDAIRGPEGYATWHEAAVAERVRRVKAEKAQPAPEPVQQVCRNCDGTGDVHSLEGEWRGRCWCPAAQPVQQAGEWTDEQIERVLIEGRKLGERYMTAADIRGARAILAAARADAQPAELARLTELNKLLTQQVADANALTDIAQRRADAQDADRLDWEWLQRQSLSDLSMSANTGHKDGPYFVGGDINHGYGATLQQAVRAARLAEKGKV
jgi:hypothetical protein